MSFNSSYFLLFLPAVVALFYLTPRAYRWLLLLVASYVFYMSWKWQFGFLLLASTAIDYFSGLQMAKRQTRRQRIPFLLLSLAVQVGLLGYFKYAGFLSELFMHPNELFAGGDFAYNVVLPIGISFYTFQTLSYTIDVFRGRITAQKHFGLFALFVSFFPQLVSGPIERYESLMPQLSDPNKAFFNADRWRLGIQLAIWGYFKKLCVADRIAELIDPIYASPESVPAVLFLFTGLLFFIQIYCDFSGYTDIATGVARLFGVELSVNWRHPLFAFSTRDFWRRWHITLSTWFRDYVYVPLGGSRRGPWVMIGAMLAAFTLSGIWHGASITITLWGFANGTLVVSEVMLHRLGLRTRRGRGIGWLYVLVTQSLLFILFRSESGTDAVHMFQGIFSWHLFQTGLWSAVDAHLSWFAVGLTVLSIVILLGKELWELTGRADPKWRPARPLFYVVIVWLIFTIGSFKTDEFIYFQF